MPRLKDETLSIRTSVEIKQLLRLAADLERRSVASMIEILVLEYARSHELRPIVRHGSQPKQALEVAMLSHGKSPARHTNPLMTAETDS